MPSSDQDFEAFSEFERTGWEKAANPYHEHWGDLSSQSADAMLDAANVVRDGKVLDVATGAGYVAAAAHERGASAVGIDFSAAQVELASRSHPQIEFRQADAEDLPFPDGMFDAVVMGFGMNHMPNPEMVCDEVFRVLRRGGWFAFTVWGEPRDGEGFGIMLSAIEKHGQTITGLPEAPPYFRFADRNEASQLLRRSGFVDAEITRVEQVWHHDSMTSLYDAFNEGAVRATAMLRSQPREHREKIRAHIHEETLKLKDGTKYVIPVPAVLSSARKP